MSQKPLLSPVNLRKNEVPVICIYGDMEDRALTRMVWDFIPGHDVRISTPYTPEELYEDAYNSAIVFVKVDEVTSKNIEIAEKLSSINGVVADIIAITAEQDIRSRLHIHAAKYDAIYNLKILSTEDFRNIFLHKLKKGIMRLNARIQEDEYNTFLGFLSVSADAFIVFDKQKRIFYVSDHYTKRYPNSHDSFTRGTPVQKVFEVVAAEMGVAETDPRYASAYHFFSHLKGQYEFRLDNGTYLRMTAVDLPGNQGTIVSTTNITTYKTQEIALAEKQEELERALSAEQEASNLQKQFIGMVSHEFRTPLAIVDGNAQILERRLSDLPESEVRKRLRTIRSAVSRTVNMMQAVLSSNLLKTGKLDVYLEEFSLQQLITELCEEQANLARDFRINVDVQELPPFVSLDKKILMMVLTNLLSNAVKFSGEHPEIDVLSYVRAGEIYIEVADKGIGIPDSEIPQIFGRFYRASTANGIPGSGVGLSLVHDLVQIHEGHVHVKSKLGEGTTFTVIFPLYPTALRVEDIELEGK
ncbi:MAG: HAMP domain-containing sensor histidine kinase [Pseudobdellovibrionaceae bacterium]